MNCLLIDIITLSYHKIHSRYLSTPFKKTYIIYIRDSMMIETTLLLFQSLERRLNMNCSDNCSSCLFDVLKKILILQKQDFDQDRFVGCDKPFLGPTTPSIFYNTRPFELYNCCTGTPWTFSYTLPDGTTATTNIFRVESLDDCCCVCRLLALNEETSEYTDTDSFVTIDLNCCGAIQCLADTYIEL